MTIAEDCTWKPWSSMGTILSVFDPVKLLNRRQ